MVPLMGLALSLVLLAFLPWLVVRSLAFNARNSALRNIRFNFNGTLKDAATVFVLWPILVPFTLGILAPYVFFRQKKFIVENSAYGSTTFNFSATAKEYYRIVFVALIPVIIGIILIAGAGAVVPPAALIVAFALYLYLFAFFTVKTTNLLFSTTLLASHRFKANLKIKEYLLLVLTNSLGIALTLGLFHPWAKVRTLRYKLEHMTLVASGDLDGFIAEGQKQVSAVGDQFSDVFDFDIGL